MLEDSNSLFCFFASGYFGLNSWKAFLRKVSISLFSSWFTKAFLSLWTLLQIITWKFWTCVCILEFQDVSKKMKYNFNEYLVFFDVFNSFKNMLTWLFRDRLYFCTLITKCFPAISIMLLVIAIQIARVLLKYNYCCEVVYQDFNRPC